jgi:hypothetical protein
MREGAKKFFVYSQGGSIFVERNTSLLNKRNAYIIFQIAIIIVVVVIIPASQGGGW